MNKDKILNNGLSVTGVSLGKGQVFERKGGKMPFIGWHIIYTLGFFSIHTKIITGTWQGLGRVLYKY